MSALLRTALAAALLAAAALGSAGCSTQAFCFSDCGPGAGTGGHPATSSTSTGMGTGGHGGGDCIFGNCGTTSATTGTGGSDSGTCVPSNGGVEICDGLDNDCNGTIDDVPGLDPTDPKTCGTCSNNCYAIPGSNWDVGSIKCDPGSNPGSKPGTCSGSCAQDYFDLNQDGRCEYYCVKSADDDTLCNNKDDNCNGLVDEGVDLCHSTTDCGACGHNCSLPHATPVCVHQGAGTTCDPSNTACQIQACDCNGPSDCWYDLDKSAATGCEYPCFPTGPEICGDGIDNDCNGLIHEADPGVVSADPTKPLGGACNGSPVGICGDAAHQGAWTCQSHQLVCIGPNVLHPGEQPETCNGKDDDCDGVVDNNPTDAGGFCGGAMFFPCQKGTYQCQAGALVCVGAINPQPETCDGIDNDCDGVIDNNLPAAQNGAACNVPIPPPAGATSPCKAGTTQCAGGTVSCVGAIGPSGASDTCGVDANCDGVLTNQPNLMTDVHNCGSCGHDCLTGAVHSTWTCVAGTCTFGGCQPGYHDNGGPGDAVAGDQKCGYACTPTGTKELCNGLDDNCDGQVDEAANLTVPSPVQVCGVSVSATAPECTTGVTVQCTAGKWQCTFPAGVCNPTCAAAMEVCDGLDNNCNGLVNENVPNFGQPCASDDGKAPPGDGVCRTTGTFVCNGASGTKCSAVKDLTKVGPELCDGLDNDCDGLVDEPYTNKGSNTTYWVKPAVVKIGGDATLGPWIFAYEASRPSASGTSAGAGNGFQTVAPAGVTLDKTHACSQPGVIPWANLTPREMEQSCVAIGGRACTLNDWQRTCRVDNADGTGPNTPDTNNSCNWGYDPLGSCSTAADYATTFCNLGPYDFDSTTAGDQDGLLPTASPLLKHCRALWDGYNGVTTQAAYYITGNLRETTRCQLDRAVCGTDATKCAIGCCSGTSTAVTGTRLCGTLADARRLSGQACAANTDCCNLDDSCTANGSCINDASAAKYCANLPAPTTSCRTLGVACTLGTQCCNGEPCTNGFCGGAETLPGSTYPIMGGSYVTGLDSGAACDFAFYKVSNTFKLYDTGFRCCFDAKPD